MIPIWVSDPDQIAPVVTGDGRRWRDVPASPQRAAPEALVAAFPEAVTRLRLSASWRLGPQTTVLIQLAFYPDLPFISARPPRHIQLDGVALPELSIQVATPLAGPGDTVLAAAAAARVRELLSGGLVLDGDGNERFLQPHDVAVITPHVEQASAVAARLTDLPGVLIGTANQAQGLEREAVVVIHPLAGYREAPPFATDPRTAVRRPFPPSYTRHDCGRHQYRLRAGNPALRPQDTGRDDLTCRTMRRTSTSASCCR